MDRSKRIHLMAALMALAASTGGLPSHTETVAQKQRRERTDDDLSARQRKRQAKMARRAAKHAAENKTTGDAGGGDHA